MGASGASGARRSILLLVSSMSAGGRSVRLGPRIVRILRGGGWEVAVRLTTPGDDPVAIAGGVVAGSIVAALGGDGYLSAVACGCHESDAIFAPLPGGRGNDLCRALGIGTDPLARARSLARLGLTSDEAGALSSDSLTSRVRPLDGMWVRTREGVRLALGVVSIGLDARANILANESSLTSGPLAYGYGAFRRRYHPGGLLRHERRHSRGVPRRAPAYVSRSASARQRCRRAGEDASRH